MSIQFRYGIDSVLELELPSEALVACCDAPRGVALADPAEALRRVLAKPLEFPPLAQSIVPDDKIALALDHDVPQTPLLVAGIVETLVAAGILPCDITIVRTGANAEAGAADPRSSLAAEIQPLVRLLTHDPTNRDQLSYLATASDSKPIYMNRAICEADMVIPIGCARLRDSLGYVGPASGIFPAFSDEHTAARFRSPKVIASAGRRKRLHALTEEASWLLGVLFAVEVVPGAGEELLEIVAGHSAVVHSRCQELCEAAWSYSVPRRADLVVAAVEGDAGRQSWECFARALAAASHAVTDGGAIAICTDLAANLGPGTQRLCNAEDLNEVLRELAKDRPIDAMAAAELAIALQNGPIYLLSRLDASLVEDMGIAHVADNREMARLIARHDSCILLANAQHAIPVPASEKELCNELESQSETGG